MMSCLGVISCGRFVGVGCICTVCGPLWFWFGVASFFDFFFWFRFRELMLIEFDSYTLDL